MRMVVQSILFHIRFFFVALFASLKVGIQRFFRQAPHRFSVAQDLALFETKEGILKCVGCKLCEAVCPVQAIVTDTRCDEQGNPYPSRFEVDMTKCITCGLCEQACPEDAIGLVNRTLVSVDEKEKLYHTLDTLRANGRPEGKRNTP